MFEAEITGRLEHPGVVPVYGLGCDPGGRPFYAMRLVKGDTLKEAIDRFHASAGTTLTDASQWNLALRQLLNRFVVVRNVQDRQDLGPVDRTRDAEPPRPDRFCHGLGRDDGGEVGPTIRKNSMPFSVAFDPDGRYLLKEGPGHTVKVWDARTREPVGEIGRHDHQIWSMKFRPDGRRLATASVDGTVRMWAWDPAHLGEMQEPELTLSVARYGVWRPGGIQP